MTRLTNLRPFGRRTRAAPPHPCPTECCCRASAARYALAIKDGKDNRWRLHPTPWQHACDHHSLPLGSRCVAIIKVTARHRTVGRRDISASRGSTSRFSIKSQSQAPRWPKSQRRSDLARSQIWNPLSRRAENPPFRPSAMSRYSDKNRAITRWNFKI